VRHNQIQHQQPPQNKNTRTSVAVREQRCRRPYIHAVRGFQGLKDSNLQIPIEFIAITNVMERPLSPGRGGAGEGREKGTREKIWGKKGERQSASCKTKDEIGSRCYVKKQNTGVWNKVLAKLESSRKDFN